MRGTRIRWPADRRKSPDPGLTRNMDAGAGVPSQGHGPAQGDGRGGQGRAGPHGRASGEGAGLPDADGGVPAGAASLREPPASGSFPTRRGPSPARLSDGATLRFEGTEPFPCGIGGGRRARKAQRRALSSARASPSLREGPGVALRSGAGAGKNRSTAEFCKRLQGLMH